MWTIVLALVLFDVGLHLWGMFRKPTKSNTPKRVTYLTPGREQRTLERAERDEE